MDQDDKSLRIIEIEFRSYLEMTWFSEAKEVLMVLKDKSPELYLSLEQELDLAIKNKKFNELNEERLGAIKYDDFDEAYLIFQEQKNLNIREEAELVKMELEIKESHFNSLESKRLEHVDSEEFDQAFKVLNEQRLLDIKDESELDGACSQMNGIKIALLEKYYDELKELVEGEQILESELKIKQIQKIEANFPLDREIILLMIYQYKLKDANIAISNLYDDKLISELEEVIKLNTKMLNDEIRYAARLKDYDFFEIYSNVWDNKDEYSMSPLHYFALEADTEGLGKALIHTSYPFSLANIFGHNFIDLIGFACDPNLGNKQEDVLEILGSFSFIHDNKKLRDRISYIETGSIKDFSYYNLPEEMLDKLSEKELKRIQQVRLSYLNKKLVSKTHFTSVLGYLEEQISSRQIYNGNDSELIKSKIMEQMFFDDFKDEDYPLKDEFETNESHRNTIDDFHQEKLGNVESSQEFEDYYESKLNNLNNLLETKDNYYLYDLSIFITINEKSLQILEEFDDEKYLLKLFDIYFPINAPSVEMGIYDADNEVFLMIVDENIKEMPVTSALAGDFKKSFSELKVTSRRVFEEDSIVDALIYEFDGEKFVLAFEKRHASF